MLVYGISWGTCKIRKFFASQGAVCSASSEAAPDDSLHETLQLPGSGTNLTSSMLVKEEENTGNDQLSDSDHYVEDRTFQKEPGTSSMLRYLTKPGDYCSQLKHLKGETVQEACVPTSSGDSEGGNMLQTGQISGNHKRWSYDVNEIDPTVINELPQDIQEELRGWMRPQKQHISSKGKNISYFSSTLEKFKLVKLLFDQPLYIYA